MAMLCYASIILHHLAMRFPDRTGAEVAQHPPQVLLDFSSLDQDASWCFHASSTFWGPFSQAGPHRETRNWDPFVAGICILLLSRPALQSAAVDFHLLKGGIIVRWIEMVLLSHHDVLQKFPDFPGHWIIWLKLFNKSHSKGLQGKIINHWVRMAFRFADGSGPEEPAFRNVDQERVEVLQVGLSFLEAWPGSKFPWASWGTTKV